MTNAITVANTDWEIIDNLMDALKGVTIEGVRVFSKVTASMSEEQALECHMKGTPVAVVIYGGTDEFVTPEDVRGCYVSATILVMAKKQSGVDEVGRAKEAFRLTNAAKNAVEISPPSDASAWGDADNYHNKLEWGEPDIDLTGDEGQPWIVIRLPLEIGFVLATGTSH